MSPSDRTRGTPGAPLDVPATPGPTGSQDPYGSWLDRMQRARARHAPITRNLHTWSNYKSWAEQIKDSWQDETKKK